MIEIVFSDSACGSLKMAQRYGEGSFHSGCIGIIMDSADGRSPTSEEIEAARQEAEQRERLAWEKAVPLGGDPANVYGISLGLSIGDISENTPGPRRRQVLEWLWSIYPAGDRRDAVQGLLQNAAAALRGILNRAQHEPLRIWYSSQPDDMCGLCFLMAQLADAGTPYKQISLIQLPQWEAVEEHNLAVFRSGWGEVSPGEWHRYLGLQRDVPQPLCRSLAERWRTLQEENAPLRAVINGHLASVPETLYDPFIQREIDAEGEEFHEAVVIGRVLGSYQLGIGDAWVALRIEELIRKGVLEPVSEAADDSPIYHRKLKKTVRSAGITGIQTET